MSVDTPKRTTRSGSASGPSLNDLKNLIESVRKDVIKAMKNEIDSLKETMGSLQSDLNELSSKYRVLQAKYNDLDNEVVTMKMQQLSREVKLTDELEDRTRRRCNLIISGLPELPSDSPENSSELDSSCFSEILRATEADSDNFLTATRVGRLTQRGPRLLKVKTVREGEEGLTQ